MGKSGQYTLEFMILLIGILFIFIPAFYFLMDYSLDAKSEMTGTHVESFSKKITNEARDMYYRGNFNKEIITLKVPDNINNMTTIRLNSSTKEEYYLRINYTGSHGERSLLIPTEVAIINDNVVYQPDCYPNEDCYYFHFPKNAIAQGDRDFKLESVKWNGITAINISVV